MFGDSSHDVFCAVRFLRVRIIETEQTELVFVLGKSWVSPMKALSSPKLKLLAKLLASRFKEDVLRAFSINVKLDWYPINHNQYCTGNLPLEKRTRKFSSTRKIHCWVSLRSFLSLLAQKLKLQSVGCSTRTTL